MGRGGYLHWQDRKRWAANNAYSVKGVGAAVLESIENLPAGVQRYPTQVYRKIAAQTVYGIIGKASTPGEPMPNGTQRYADRARGKDVAAQAYQVFSQVPPPNLIGLDVELQKQVFPNRARRKSAGNQAYYYLGKHPVADVFQLPVELQKLVYPTRAERKVTAPSAFWLPVKMSTPGEPLPEGTQRYPNIARGKLAANQVYAVLAKLPPPELAAIPEELSRQIYPDRARRRVIASSAYMVILRGEHFKSQALLIYALTREIVSLGDQREISSIGDQREIRRLG